MECICCKTTKIKTKLIFDRTYFYCCKCRLLFYKQRGGENSVDKIKRHYKNIDPFEEVANSKRIFFKKALEALELPKKNKLILDIGCGYGHFLALAKNRGWKIFGIEIVEHALQELNNKYGSSNRFFRSLEEGQFNSHFFDAITLWDVLVIVDDPSKILKECHRILASGGKIGIRVRNVMFQKFAYGCYALVKKIALKFGFKNPSVFHKYCFSPKSIYHLLSRLEYTNIKISNSPLTSGDPYSHSKNQFLVKSTKLTTYLISKFVFWITKGKILIGPSLLIWAEKP